MLFIIRHNSSTARALKIMSAIARWRSARSKRLSDDLSVIPVRTRIATAITTQNSLNRLEP